MFKLFINVSLLLSTLTAVSCVENGTELPEPLPEEQIPAEQSPETQEPEGITPGVPWDDTPTTFTVQLTFNGTPTNIRFADLKYNKIGAFSMDWDDGSNTCMDAMELFNSLTVPDGTGKDLPWRGGVAIIGRSAYNDIELGASDDLSNISYEQMNTLIANGWDIENHGLYSGGGGNYESETPSDDIKNLDRLLLSRIGYKMAVTVVPGMEDGYVEAAAEQGHLAATSQRNDVGGSYVAHPEAEWKPLTDIQTWDPGFKYLTRLFTDTWDSEAIAEKVEELLQDDGQTSRKLLRIGTHDSSPEGFKEFIAKLSVEMDGRYLVCSMRELMEYHTLTSKSVLTVDGQSITVEVPAGLRWEDFTLVVEGAEVLSATCDQADEITFSGNLVNVYKDRRH